MGVQVIRDHDATCEGGDFMRVYCQHKRGSPATFATIERVFGGAVRTQTWCFRTLVDCAPMDAEVATQLAAAYAAATKEREALRGLAHSGLSPVDVHSRPTGFGGRVCVSNSCRAR